MCISYQGNYDLSLPVGFWVGGTWSLESHLITVATLQDDPGVDLGFWRKVELYQGLGSPSR